MQDNFEDDFAGFLDDTASDIDFFSEEESTETAVPATDTATNPTPEANSKEKEDSADVEVEASLFEEAEATEESEALGEESTEDTAEETVETGESVSALTMLKEKGYLNYELGEDEELTEQKAAELIEDSFDNLFEEKLEELFADVPEVVKQMNKFVLKGGDINEFLDTVAVQKSSGISDSMDLKDEANQELIVRQGLSEEGYDKEYIDAQIDFLKDSKRLEGIAGTHFNKWQKANAAEQARILQSNQAADKAAKQQRRELKNKVSSFLQETEEVSGFTVTRQDRKQLPNYMSDRTIKLENGNQVTGMQRDLMRVLNSPTGSVQIAKLLQAANEDGVLSFEEIKQQTESKVTEKVRDNVRRNKKSVISGAGSTKKKKPLASYFN